ncbi:MAG: O-acetyl-ADP-ribose deacetylase [Lachnospiraceae bacterium]|nr:O-acetyl-ADP-ribose deacetylase [Lachnospiraceae bacterium]
MIQSVKGDITKIVDVDAIVNAANMTLLGGGGVDGAIHRAAGKGLFWECVKLHGCKTGEAKITKGFKLPCAYVIHTVGPVWHGGKKRENELLANCYRNSLEVAKENGIRRIAFPSISTGMFHYPIDKAADVAIATVKTFLKENPGVFDTVKFVLFDDPTFEEYKKRLI